MKVFMRKYFGVSLLAIFLPLFSCASTPRNQTALVDAEAYNNRGDDYANKGHYDQAILDWLSKEF